MAGSLPQKEQKRKAQSGAVSGLAVFLKSLGLSAHGFPIPDTKKTTTDGF
jgi:hypothetical protein